MALGEPVLRAVPTPWGAKTRTALKLIHSRLGG